MPIPKWAMPKPKKGMALANLLIKDVYLPIVTKDIIRHERQFALFLDPLLKHREQLEYMERP